MKHEVGPYTLKSVSFGTLCSYYLHFMASHFTIYYAKYISYILYKISYFLYKISDIVYDILFNSTYKISYIPYKISYLLY